MNEDITNENENEKKMRRPRIASSQSFERNNSPYTNRPYTNENNSETDGEGAQEYNSRRYQPRAQYRNQRNYQPRRPFNNREFDQNDLSNDQQTNQNHGAYQPRHDGYQPRHNGYYNRQGSYQGQNSYNGQRPYQHRQNGYQYRQNDYQRNNGGYHSRQEDSQNQNGYQQNQHRNNYQPREGYNEGYGNRSGYQSREGGYNQHNSNRFNNQGGFRNNQSGYRHNNNGGYSRHHSDNGAFQPRGKSFTPRPKRIEYEMQIPDPNEQIRLNKFMSNSGLCSRREADEFIQQGLVKVNGQVVTELGTKITHKDIVEYDEKVLALESKCYILLNKPKDCVTTTDDPQERKTVLDIVKGACSERIYPVGRLDRNTTGVLLLTNDGDLASKLTHPKYVKKKIYHVWTDRDISEEDMQKIADGIELEDGPVQVDAISYATETDKNQAGIEIHSGRNRVVRRIFESLGYRVTKLDRVYFAGLTKKNLPRGRWRYLTQQEVNFLKMGSFE